MKERERKLLKNKSTRQFLVEVFVVGTLLTVLLTSVVEPLLLSQFPSVFPEAPIRTGPPQAWVPDTRVSWLTTTLGALLLGSYMYYRIHFTDLGEEMLSIYSTDR